MSDVKFIGLDVHKTSISAAVLDQRGKLVMRSIFATHAASVLSFIHGLGGTLRVTFEEGTHSTWLYDLLRPHVSEVLVCDPHKNGRVAQPSLLLGFLLAIPNKWVPHPFAVFKRVR